MMIKELLTNRHKKEKYVAKERQRKLYDEMIHGEGLLSKISRWPTWGEVIQRNGGKS